MPQKLLIDWPGARTISPSRLRNAFGEPVIDCQRQRERVALLWVEKQLHDDSVGPLVAGCPAQPAGQAVNRVAPVRLAQWRLMGNTPELVSPVLQSVRPG